MSHSHLRYQGIIQGTIDRDIIDVKALDFEKLCDYDSQYFPSHRPRFLEKWIHQPRGQGYAVVKDDRLSGYGVIRKAIEGFKIGPLFAEMRDIAQKILLALSTYARSSPISLDVPDLNLQAIDLVESYPLRSTLECQRMYNGPSPSLDWTKIWGVTTLEIG